MNQIVSNVFPITGTLSGMLPRGFVAPPHSRNHTHART
jgi:hypothetical protein